MPRWKEASNADSIWLPDWVMDALGQHLDEQETPLVVAAPVRIHGTPAGPWRHPVAALITDERIFAVRLRSPENDPQVAWWGRATFLECHSRPWGGTGPGWEVHLTHLTMEQDPVVLVFRRPAEAIPVVQCLTRPAQQATPGRRTCLMPMGRLPEGEESEGSASGTWQVAGGPLRDVRWAALVQDPAGIAALADRGDVRISRVRGPDLLLRLADRTGRASDAAVAAARVLRTILTHVDLDVVRQVFQDEFRWARRMPDADIRALVDDFIRGAFASAELDEWEVLAQVLREWKATADVYADPELARRLRSPIGTEGGIPSQGPDGL